MTTNPIAAKKAPMTPATTQILFVDIQSEIIGSSATNPPEALVRSAVALARIGKLFGLPMCASVVPVGPEPPRLVPELAGSPLLVRTAAAAFEDGPTASAIEAAGRHDLVICGAVTEVAVLLACFGAEARGYEVHVPVDACGGTTRRTEEAALRRIESFDANTAAVTTLGAVLAGDLASPQGVELMAILKPIMG